MHLIVNRSRRSCRRAAAKAAWSAWASDVSRQAKALGLVHMPARRKPTKAGEGM